MQKYQIADAYSAAAPHLRCSHKRCLGFHPGNSHLSALYISKESAQCSRPKKFIPQIISPQLSCRLKIAPTTSAREAPDLGDLCLSGGTATKTAFSPPKTATVGGKLYNLQTPLRNCESPREKVSSLFCELGKIYTEPLKLQIFGGGAVKMTHWVTRINRPCFL